MSWDDVYNKWMQVAEKDHISYPDFLHQHYPPPEPLPKPQTLPEAAKAALQLLNHESVSSEVTEQHWDAVIGNLSAALDADKERNWRVQVLLKKLTDVKEVHAECLNDALLVVPAKLTDELRELLALAEDVI